MKILSIETSCDETALAVVEVTDVENSPKFKVLASALHSQIETHKEFGGVFPAMAKREHALNIVPLLRTVGGECGWMTKETDISEHMQKINEIMHREKDLEQTLIEFLQEFPTPDIDYIAVTEGPGLEPALWIGINVAQILSLVWNIPLVPTNHMEGHISSVLIDMKNEAEERKTKETVEFPAIALLISGGHTELVLSKDWGNYEIIGKTLDDAIGEAYDKVARMLGLEYPGGPEISILAKKWREMQSVSRPNASPTASTVLNEKSPYTFPRPMLHNGNLDFSFSGLKTSVLYTVQKIENLTEEIKQEIAYEFEEAVTELLIKKTKSAIESNGAKSLIVGGGVIANQHIRESLTQMATESGSKIFLPTKDLSTDNAVMIAIAGFFRRNNSTDQIGTEIKAHGNLTYFK